MAGKRQETKATRPLGRGYVHVYTGDGKGKTTAALGLCLRAVGAGMRIYVGQFIKAGDYSEIKVLKQRFPELVIEQFGRGRFLRGRPTEEDLCLGREGLARLTEAVSSGAYDLVVADEILGAIKAGMLPPDSALALCDAKGTGVELVLTGRDAPESLVARADLATEMRMVKHYFESGVGARIGIEM